MLLSLHTIAAARFKAPEWELEKEEARALTDAIGNVAQHYEIPILSDKHQAIIGLCICAFGIYAPRVGATMMKAQKQRTRERSEDDGGAAVVTEPARVMGSDLLAQAGIG